MIQASSKTNKLLYINRDCLIKIFEMSKNPINWTVPEPTIESIVEKEPEAAKTKKKSSP